MAVGRAAGVAAGGNPRGGMELLLASMQREIPESRYHRGTKLSESQLTEQNANRLIKRDTT